MSSRPPPYQGYSNYYYSHVQNGSYRTSIINEESNVPPNYTSYTAYTGYTGYTGYTDGFCAQQPFPNNPSINFNGCHKPEIPWKGPKEFEIDPEEFNNLEIIVSGHSAQGNLLITRSLKDTATINVTAQVLLSHESLQSKVEILSSYDSSNYALRVKTPEFSVFPNSVLININVTFPKNLKYFGSLSINVINLNVDNVDLKDITFDNIDWKLNPSINVKDLKSRKISVHSYGQISGNYFIDESLLLQTSNSQISANAKSFSDSTPKSIKLVTSNSAIRGSFPLAYLFEARTSNGGIDLNIMRASQNERQNAGKIVLNTSNGNISGVHDVNSEWRASTSNGGIKVKLNPVNTTELIRMFGKTTNGNISTLIPNSYRGQFNLKTSNGKAKIEGTNDYIYYSVNANSLKAGYKGEYNNKELSLSGSNGKVNLAFF